MGPGPRVAPRPQPPQLSPGRKHPQFSLEHPAGGSVECDIQQHQETTRMSSESPAPVSPALTPHELLPGTFLPCVHARAPVLLSLPAHPGLLA